MIPAPCVGRCEVAPCVVVGQNPVGNATVESVNEAVSAGRTGPRRAALHRLRRVSRRRAAIALLADCLAGRRTREDVTKIMEDSGLRGLGGAGFPAGRKWRLVAAEPSPRVMAVNIDEGEPGTFKDRWYLERDPHRFLEGHADRRVVRRRRRDLDLSAGRVRGLPRASSSGNCKS